MISNTLIKELKERLILRKLQRCYEQSEDEFISNNFEIKILIKQIKGLNNAK